MPWVKPIKVLVALAVVPPNVVVVKGKEKAAQAAPADCTTPPLVTWRQLVEELPRPLMVRLVVEAVLATMRVPLASMESAETEEVAVPATVVVAK
jgi:hypothetical protein